MSLCYAEGKSGRTRAYCISKTRAVTVHVPDVCGDCCGCCKTLVAPQKVIPHPTIYSGEKNKCKLSVPTCFLLGRSHFVSVRALAEWCARNPV